MAYGSKTITTAATLIVPANPQRISLMLTNTSAGTVYLGDDANVTVSTGFNFPQNAQLQEDSGGQRMWLGNVYGIVASGTADVRYWERTATQ